VCIFLWGKKERDFCAFLKQLHGKKEGLGGERLLLRSQPAYLNERGSQEENHRPAFPFVRGGKKGERGRKKE